MDGDHPRRFGSCTHNAILAGMILLSPRHADHDQHRKHAKWSSSYPTVSGCQAACKLLLVDHTKFHKRALHRLAPITEFDVVIVDPDTARADLEAIIELGVHVEIAVRRPSG
jgi:hypothetical protein